MPTNVTGVPADEHQWEKVSLATENDRFKAKYDRYLQVSLAASLVIYLLIFLFSPVLEITPYRLREESIEVVDIPQTIDIPPPPQELPKPQVPIEAAPDAEVEEDDALGGAAPQRLAAGGIHEVDDEEALLVALGIEALIAPVGASSRERLEAGVFQGADGSNPPILTLEPRGKTCLR